MTVYSLDGILPELPPENDYWIAPNAVVIGKVKLERDVGIWFGAATMSSFISVKAATSRMVACSIPIWVHP